MQAAPYSGATLSMVQSEISFRAALSYIETYYLQLKATQVSIIHSLTNLQLTQTSSQDPTGPISPSCLTVSHMWGTNRTNNRVELGKLGCKDEESNVLLQMWNGKAFLYEGRRARQFSNI